MGETEGLPDGAEPLGQLGDGGEVVGPELNHPDNTQPVLLEIGADKHGTGQIVRERTEN